MYGAMWRALPGRRSVKLAVSTVLLGGVLLLLWFVVFPVAEQRLPFNDVTVNTPAAVTPEP